MWFVYVLVSCDSRRTYSGITNHPEQRLRAHNGLIKGGAKATRGWRPWKFLHLLEIGPEKRIAQIIESKIKTLNFYDKFSREIIEGIKHTVSSEFIANRNVMAEQIIRHLQKNDGMASINDLSKRFGEQLRPALNHLSDSNQIEIKNDEILLK